MALVVEQREVAEISAAFGLTANAVYIWRNRLKQAAREASDRLKASPPEPLKDPPTAARREG